MTTFPPCFSPQSTASSTTVHPFASSLAIQSHPLTTFLWCFAWKAMSSGVRAYESAQVVQERVAWPAV